jgi:hypothetical protein
MELLTKIFCFLFVLSRVESAPAAENVKVLLMESEMTENSYSFL